MSRLPLIRLAALLAALAIVTDARADYTPAQLKADLKLFDDAKLPHGDKDLLQFFQSRQLSEQDAGRVASLIEKLSSKAFKEREQARADLEKIGPPALAALRKAAHTSTELEIKQRAALCIKVIEEKSPNSLLTAAARILRHRRAEGAAKVLLEFIAIAPDEAVEEEVFACIYTLALEGAKLEILPPMVKAGKLEPALIAALSDKSATRRAVAALVVAHYGTPEQCKAVSLLLNDNAPEVRFRAAQGLAIAKDKSGVPVLIKLLDKNSMKLALQAEDLLSIIALEKGPMVPLGESKEQCEKCQTAWQTWWDKSNDSIDLAKVTIESPFGGLVSRATAGALQFAHAIEEIQRKQDVTLLMKVTDVPFTFGGLTTFKTRKEFEDFLQMTFKAVQPMPDKQTKFKVEKVVPATDYVKAAPENERDFLEAARVAQVQVVYLNIDEGQIQSQSLPLFIRISGGRARCIGFGFPAAK